MPPKVRDLERELRQAGFRRISGKGSHRKYLHPSGASVNISGGGGEDAQRYQEKEVAAALRQARGEG